VRIVTAERLDLDLELASVPRLAAGVELLGQLKDSAFADPPSLVQRADGQVIQLSRLVYLVVSLIDGTRGADQIADLASASLGRSLTADQVRYLLENKLAPLGIVTRPGEEPVALPTASPLLSLRARITLLPEVGVAVLGAFLRPLFRWPVIVAVLVSVCALDYWIVSVNGLGAALNRVLASPVDLLLVVALTTVSALFHECGHAAGCRYSGARPGRIGVGVYLVYPAFFTNVTDSYRLDRAGRLRTDLGGVYFNLVFIVVLAGLYAATLSPILLLVIALTHLEILEQLLPFVRFDGYFILSDIVGVPDLFARVVPVLRSTLSRNRSRNGGQNQDGDARVAGLRRPARIAITTWVLIVIPLLTVMLGYLMLRLPASTRALWHSADQSGQMAATNFSGQHYAVAAADAVGAVLAAISIAGSLWIAAGLLRRGVVVGGRWSAGQPRRRVIFTIIGAGVASLLAFFWLAQGQFSGW
jgi:putative peptide zinc metalloprotease protein